MKEIKYLYYVCSIIILGIFTILCIFSNNNTPLIFIGFSNILHYMIFKHKLGGHDGQRTKKNTKTKR